MANYVVTDTELTNVANSIREKSGTTESLSWPTEYISAIEDIQTGSGELFAAIGVTYPEGSTCTATNGIMSVTAPDTNGYALFGVFNPTEVWTISCMDNQENTDSQNVTVSTYAQIKEITLTYNKIDIANCTITHNALIYNGSAQEPTFTITYDGVQLVEGIDYTSNHTKGTNASSGQTSELINYTTTFIGIGLYIGTTTKQWTINKAFGGTFSDSYVTFEVTQSTKTVGNRLGYVYKFKCATISPVRPSTGMVITYVSHNGTTRDGFSNNGNNIYAAYGTVNGVYLASGYTSGTLTVKTVSSFYSQNYYYTHTRNYTITIPPT